MTDACLVAIAEHGFVPSIQAARMTYAAAHDALQGAVSEGLLGCGTVILGASETAGVLLADILKRRDADSTDIDTAARSEENTSELQSLMRISYAVICLKKKKRTKKITIKKH